jgi:hypothetical protein
MTAPGTLLTPAELQAIEVHKYFLSIERRAEVPIEEAIADFARHHAAEWRRDKARRDAEDQLREIETLRAGRSVAEGREVSHAEAVMEWCACHAAEWRAARESLERNGFVRTSLVAGPAAPPLALSGATVAAAVEPYDCDVYVHGRGIEHASFVLGGRPFTRADAVRAVPALEVVPEDPVEFIATGACAREALSSLREFLVGFPLEWRTS